MTWCDWAIFLFKIKGSLCQYPGQIIGFVDFDPVTAAAYNSVWDKGTVAKTGGIHALAELTQNALTNFDDPSGDMDAGQQLQPNSSLFFWELKEKINGLHNVRCITQEAILNPVVAFADFSPEFEHKKDRMVCKSWRPDELEGSYIYVRPQKYWADVFVQKARKAYREHNKDEKEARQNRSTNK